MKRRTKILHIINSFEFGGAEAMLCNILLRTDLDRFDPVVISLIDDLSVAGPVIKAGVPIEVIGLQPPIPRPQDLWRLRSHLSKLQPDIVQTWMDHSNLLGGSAARLFTGAAVVWGIHHSVHVAELAKRTTQLTVSACAHLSRLVPSAIILCSHHSALAYSARGFDRTRMHVIPNGFDLNVFQRDPAGGASLRQELGIDLDTIVVGMIGRFDPLKDHKNFLDAAVILCKKYTNVRLLMCGAGITAANQELMSEVHGRGLGERCVLAGPRHDMSRVYNAIDVVASSSVSEAFPLVLGEAMACGVPCVATDVGDSAHIVGSAGRVVPLRDSRALANALSELIALGRAGRAALGNDGRRRISELFDLNGVTRRYEAVYDQVLARKRGNSGFRPAPAKPAITAAA